MPPDSVWTYRFHKPITLASSVCELFVGDELDGAIHVFAEDGSFRRSIDLIHVTGDPSAGVSALAVSADGSKLIVGDARGRRVWIRDAGRWTSVSIPDDGGTVRPATAVVLVDSSSFLERSRPLPVFGVAAEAYVARRWSFDGQFMGRVGLLPRVGHNVPAQLVNLLHAGGLQRDGDHFWMLRYYDGFLFKFKAGSPDESPVDQLSTGRFTPLDVGSVAVDSVGGRVFPESLQVQASAFSVDDRGGKHVGHLAPNRRDWYVVSSLGSTIEYTAVVGRPRGIASLGERIWIILDAGSSRSLQAFRNPLADETVEPCDSTPTIG